MQKDRFGIQPCDIINKEIKEYPQCDDQVTSEPTTKLY